MNVLVLESSKLYQKIFSDLFVSLGHFPRIVDNSKDGLKIFRHEDIGMICVAMNLVDTTGLEFTKKIRKKRNGQHATIVLMISEQNETIMKESMECGVTEICNKTNAEELSHKITYMMNRQIDKESKNIRNSQIIYIEDDKYIYKMTLAMLAEMGVNATHFTSAEEALDYYIKTDQHHDLIVTDIIVDGSMTGLGLTIAIRELNNQKSDIPILAITGFDDTARRIELFRAGINDYIIKPFVEEELTARVTNLISNSRMVHQIRIQQKKLYELAMTDHLTKCNNRHALNQLAPKYFAEAVRHKKPLGLLIIDLDFFKKVNDEYGHAKGDDVLQEIGQLLIETSRTEDLVARFGGEEFLILLPHCNGGQVKKKAQILRQKIELLKPAGLELTASIGATVLSAGLKMDFFELFKVADQAVYQSKEEGRNRVTYLPVES
ncbi:MAG: diguanylate cyclase [Methylococcales bacterium]|jgi:two-component system, cell cycle response regulator|nr:diguanylate cyclase [Methylococcales bacterium]MBT7410643.1 diguanylate cyclase [Methylococcales bacterium]